MKILHICLCGPVTDGLSYQDNMITKYHRLIGNEVYIITSKWIYDSNGNLTTTSKDKYINDEGVNIIRINMKKKQTIKTKLKKYPSLYNEIDKIKPDILFIHGCQFTDIKQIKKYAKLNKVIMYVDNHADFSNSASNYISKNILHKIIWKHYAKIINPYVKKFYGVLPARVEFLKKIYSLPNEKVELLYMGCDDNLVEKIKKENPRNKIIKKYHYSKDDFIIITGGKIDLAKKQVLLFLEAIKQINNPKIKVIIYGSVVDELQEQLLSYCNDNVKFIGWLNHEETYEHLLASDLAVYPGRHSVLWEETVGLGIPMIVKFWEGTTHVDVGGNVKFIMEDSVESIKNVLNEVLSDNTYVKMKKVASTKGIKIFSYKEIAKKSIEQ